MKFITDVKKWELNSILKSTPLNKRVCPCSVQIATVRHLPSALFVGAHLTARRTARRKIGRLIRSSACAQCPPSTLTLNNINPSCWSSRANINSLVSIFKYLSDLLFHFVVTRATLSKAIVWYTVSSCFNSICNFTFARVIIGIVVKKY